MTARTDELFLAIFGRMATIPLPFREVQMKKTHVCVSALALLLAVTGCNKTPTPAPKTSAAPAESSSASVALPPNQVPASDATIPPSASSGSSGVSSSNAGGPSQQRPVELGKTQNEANMPLSGQVNNHSVPDTTEQKTKQKQ
jgi:hypothetical protein